ncbi:MAG TPA: hypothetical protein VIL95_05440, partial [Bacillota bacterium]
VLGLVVLGEPVDGRLGLAIGFIALGTAVALADRLRPDRLGLLYGLHIAWWLAVTALLRRIGIAALPDALLGAAIGSTVALAVFTPLARPYGLWSGVMALAPQVRHSLLASGLLSAFALLFSIWAFAYAPVGPVAALQHTEPVIAQWLGHLWLGGRDRVQRQAAVGAALVACGAILI